MASHSTSANKYDEDCGDLAKTRDETLVGSEDSRDGDSCTTARTLIGPEGDICVAAVIAARVAAGKVVASFGMGSDTTNVDNDTRAA
jgi:hypothetical protein